MAEAAVVQISNPYADLTVGQLCDERKVLGDAKSALNRQIKDIDGSLKAIDDLLFEYHAANPDVDSVAGNKAKVRWTEETVFNVAAADKEALVNWLVENKAEYLMTWHLNNASTREFVALHGELPGATTFVKTKLSCTKK